MPAWDSKSQTPGTPSAPEPQADTSTGSGPTPDSSDSCAQSSDHNWSPSATSVERTRESFPTTPESGFFSGGGSDQRK